MSMYNSTAPANDFCTYQLLAQRAHRLGLCLTDCFNEGSLTRVVAITEGYGGKLLVRNEFPIRELDENINQWFRKQLNDYQSWSSIK